MHYATFCLAARYDVAEDAGQTTTLFSLAPGAFEGIFELVIAAALNYGKCQTPYSLVDDAHVAEFDARLLS